MRKNYFKTAFRRLIKNRSISIINIIGLSLGMAAIFVILMFVFHELSYDNYNQKKDRIYRIIQESEGHEMFAAQCCYPLGQVLKDDYPQIKETARLINLFHTLVQSNNEYIKEDQFFCAENSFFELFTIDVLKGNSSSLTNEPNDVVLTESMAKKYFGSLDILGEELIINSMGEELSLNVSGVIKDFPENSSFKANFITSMDLGLRQLPKLLNNQNPKQQKPEYYKNHWGFGFIITYILTDSNFDKNKFTSELKKIEKNNLPNPDELNYHLQSLNDVYFDSDHVLSKSFETGKLSTVYIFLAIGVLILLIACINYILLSTSQTLERSVEIGVRKIAGANRKALFNQVLTESIIITLIAFPLALILIEQFRPAIIQLMDKNFIHYNFNFKLIMGFGLVLFIITYLPGIFTMKHFSRISPLAALNSTETPGTKRHGAKKFLISLQFIIFLILVSSSIGVYKQVHYSKNHDLGFEPDHVMTFTMGMNPVIKNSYDSFKEELLTHKDIISVSGGMWVPPSKGRMTVSLGKNDGSGSKIKTDGLFVDKDFAETLNINLIKGKTLSEYGNNAGGKVMINETAIKNLGYEDPLGKKTGMGEIVGVIEDFHYHSYRKEIPPMILISAKSMVKEMLVKTTGQNEESVKSFILSKWKEFTGSENLTVSSLNQNFREIYKEENKLALLTAIFAGIAIFIASMGLLGLTIFTLKKRTKEIAIRKVNGATINNILGLVTFEYIKLLFFAFIISVPVAYYLISKWLQDFAYKTTVSWWIFGIAGALALIITMLTIGFKAYRAANSNPVESLRYE